MAYRKNARLKRTAVAVFLVLVAGTLILLLIPLPSERYDRAVFSGVPSQIRDALSTEPNPNRFIHPPTLENRMRRLLGYGLVGRTHPMVAAIRQGSIDAVRELSRGGVDVNGHDGTGYRALTLAAHIGDVKASEALLELGADPNRRWKDGTPIHKEATLEVRKLFVRRGIKLVP
jgi:hypothetical protein